MITKFFTLGLLLFAFAFTQAQIDSYVGAYNGVNKNGYLQPLASVLTSSFNTGQCTHTGIDSNFHIYFHLIGSSSILWGDKLKYFNAGTPADFEPAQTVSASTLLGPRKSITASGINGLGYTFPAGMGVQYLTLALPQLSLAYKGTEINIRFFAYDTKDDLGKINLWGVGMRHDIGRYFVKNSPWVTTIGGMYQKLKIGTYADLSTYSAGITIGQRHRHFYYFGQTGYQSGHMTGSYKHYNGENDENINIDLKSNNPLLLAVGAGISAGAFQFQLQLSGLSPAIVSATLGIKL